MIVDPPDYVKEKILRFFLRTSVPRIIMERRKSMSTIEQLKDRAKNQNAV